MLIRVMRAVQALSLGLLVLLCALWRFARLKYKSMMSFSSDDLGLSVEADLPAGADDSLALVLRELEAILFVASEPVPFSQVAQALELSEPELAALLPQYRASLATRGFRLQSQADTLQLVSAPETADALQRFLGTTPFARLSNAALEVLAIVAYRQPVTRAQVEAVRGVDSSGVLRSLQARELVIEVGRADTLGRPLLYATTPLFLQVFGIQRLADLPPLTLPEVADD